MNVDFIRAYNLKKIVLHFWLKLAFKYLIWESFIITTLVDIKVHFFRKSPIYTHIWPTNEYSDHIRKTKNLLPFHQHRSFTKSINALRHHHHHHHPTRKTSRTYPSIYHPPSIHHSGNLPSPGVRNKYSGVETRPQRAHTHDGPLGAATSRSMKARRAQPWLASHPLSMERSLASILLRESVWVEFRIYAPGLLSYFRSSNRMWFLRTGWVFPFYYQCG